MPTGSECRQCGAPIPAESNYCPECGAPHSMVVLDPLGVAPRLDQPADPPAHPRAALLVGLAAIAAVVAAAWGLSRGSGPSVEDGDRDDQAVDATGPVSSISPTTVTNPPTTITNPPTTTRTTTSRAPTTTTTASQLIDAGPGPVLDDAIDGRLVQLADRLMIQLDLATGEATRVELDAAWGDGAAEHVAVLGTDVVSTRAGSSLVVTDLITGTQTATVFDDTMFGGAHVAGVAGPSSVWVSSYPNPTSFGAAVEMSLDGEVLDRVELPNPAHLVWADGDELFVDTPDGSWRWNASSGEVTRLPGQIVAGSTRPLLLVSCDAPSDCHVLIDSGDGPTRADWISASDVVNSTAHVSADQSGVLIHRYGDTGTEFSYLDVADGAHTELGSLPIAPYLGIAWIDDSSWFVGRVEAFLDRLLAVDLDTGGQLEIVLPFRTSTEMYPSLLVHLPR